LYVLSQDDELQDNDNPYDMDDTPDDDEVITDEFRKTLNEWYPTPEQLMGIQENDTPANPNSLEQKLNLTLEYEDMERPTYPNGKPYPTARELHNANRTYNAFRDTVIREEDKQQKDNKFPTYEQNVKMILQNAESMSMNTPISSFRKLDLNKMYENVVKKLLPNDVEGQAKLLEVKRLKDAGFYDDANMTTADIRDSLVKDGYDLYGNGEDATAFLDFMDEETAQREELELKMDELNDPIQRPGSDIDLDMMYRMDWRKEFSQLDFDSQVDIEMLDQINREEEEDWDPEDKLKAKRPLLRGPVTKNARKPGRKSSKIKSKAALQAAEDTAVGEDMETHSYEDFAEQRQQAVFDYRYNVTNLLLSSFQVNPDAPVIPEDWYEALRKQEKYQAVRDAYFEFNWEDVDAANVTELEEYWRCMGSEAVPRPKPHENPNVAHWSEPKELDYDQEYKLAFHKWFEDVYNGEDEHDLLDRTPEEEENEEDEELQLEATEFIDDFEDTWGDMDQEWRDQFYTCTNYSTNSTDEEIFDENGDTIDPYKPKPTSLEDLTIKGHLVIACSPTHDDIDIAENITLRMEKEYGESVFVETRIYQHAKPIDKLFEIWIESWEIELLHSTRKAWYARDWEGSKEVDIEKLTEEVGFYISDEMRYSYNIPQDYFHIREAGE